MPLGWPCGSEIVGGRLEKTVARIAKAKEQELRDVTFRGLPAPTVAEWIITVADFD